MQRNSKSFPIDPKVFIKKCLEWCNSFSHFSYYRPNSYEVLHGPFKHFIGADAVKVLTSSVDSFSKLNELVKKEDSWLLGFLSYDLKNETEHLESRHPAFVEVPHLAFFEPRHLFFFSDNKVTIESPDNPALIFESIQNRKSIHSSLPEVKFNANISRDEYLQTMKHIHKHIMEGDIYELNYCIEFTAQKVNISPIEAFLSLMEISPMPFSVLQKLEMNYLISASPERFMKKEDQRVISQPMKGTIRRGVNDIEDHSLKQQLSADSKERSENVMIVDLVRNDLSRSAVPGTVSVKELFGISTFPKVHQMISTISAELHPDKTGIEAIANSFPMGSMTGAPKIRAMKLIDAYENSSRGWYSGATGYISPDGNFDFNVVIRSLLYEQAKGLLSYHVGSAITAESIPEKEYDECLLKAQSILEIFTANK